jgi:hypothetical protein
MPKPDILEIKMLLYQFSASNKKESALTQVSDGKNLPEDGAPWLAMGTQDIKPGVDEFFGVSADEILSQVSTQGFYSHQYPDVSQTGAQPDLQREIDDTSL